MDWQLQLISIYVFICNQYKGLEGYCMRHSNYADLRFSDEEALTIYLFGIVDGRKTIKEIYDYTDRHLREFFPQLPGYKAYDARINQLCDVFVPLIECIQQQANCEMPESIVNLTDAMPIVMAQRGRRFHAKVAPELATANGYCATKKMHYYGVKLHIVAAQRKGMLPLPHSIGLTDAGMHDRRAFEQIEPELQHDTFADKAYQIEASPVLERPNYSLYTPPKKQKGQQFLDAADSLLSTAISKVRQPVDDKRSADAVQLRSNKAIPI